MRESEPLQASAGAMPSRTQVDRLSLRAGVFEECSFFRFFFSPATLLLEVPVDLVARRGTTHADSFA